MNEIPFDVIAVFGSDLFQTSSGLVKCCVAIGNQYVIYIYVIYITYSSPAIRSHDRKIVCWEIYE